MFGIWLIGHAVGNALDVVLDPGCAKIDEQSQPFIQQSEIGESLFFVYGQQFSDRFQFQNDFIVDDDVSALSFL